MTTISNLPFKRFVMQVSTGAPQIKSNWQAMMADNLEKLKSPVWREASTNESSLVDHDFTKASHLDDSYDAYKMTGNYDSTAMTEVAYAGMVAYRFRLPDDYMSGSANITSISVPVYRDRFCKGGIHVAALFGGDMPTNFTWDNVRGTRGTAMPPKVAMMAQSDEAAPYLTASSAADDVATFAVNPVTYKSRYLWIILTIEDYEDGWEWYNKKEKRLYAIEGSARLAGDMLSVSFDAEVTPDGAANEFAVVRGGVVPKLPDGSASGVRVLQLQLNGDPLVPYELSNSEPTQYKVYIGGEVVATINGTITGYSYTGVTNNKRYVAICGDFDISTFGIRGLLIYEVLSKQQIDGTATSVNVNVEVLSALKSKNVKLGIFNKSGVLEIACIYKPSWSGWRMSPQPFLTIDVSTLSATATGNSFSSVQSGFTPVAYISAASASHLSDDPRYNIVFEYDGWLTTSDHYSFSGIHETSSLSIYDRICKPSGTVSFVSCTVDESGRPCLSLCGDISRVERKYDHADGSGVMRTYSAYKEYSPHACVVTLPLYRGYSSTGERSKRLLLPYNTDAALDTILMYQSSLPVQSGLVDVKAFKVSYEGGSVLVGKPVGQVGSAYSTGVNVTASGSTKVRLPYETMPVFAFARSFVPNHPDSFGLVPVAGHEIPADPTKCFMPNELANPTATNSVIGLRTLQAKFYLGQTESVVRASRARLGAAFSVRAGTVTLNVVADGIITPTEVSVWRMSATALVIPFAVPTEWRAKTLRLDWTGWTGTATNGARFAVWLRAGHWQDACPQVLESDIPYDALKAEADGWMLLGRVDATLTGANRTASFDLAGRIGSAKVASLLLTAYAPTDGINPDANTAWPVGAAKEVDVVDGEVVNAGKAWLPDITLIG